MATELSQIEVARNKILELEESLLKNNPGLPHQLRDVHRFLKAQPEVVTLFKSEPEMAAVLVKALEKQTSVEIVSAKAAKPTAAAAKKALAKSSASDLGF